MVAYNRRRLLQSIAVASALGLAGCAEEEDDTDPVDEDGLGERVPTQSISYWSDTGATTAFYEDIIPIIQENVIELGVSLEVNPLDYAAESANIIHDTREDLINCSLWTSSPQRIDPQQVSQLHTITEAGNTGSINRPNYASCEYSELINAQTVADTVEERREMVYEAHSILSNDIAVITLFPMMSLTVINNERVEVNRSGEIGLSLQNPMSIVESRPLGEADALRMTIGFNEVESSNFLTQPAHSIYIWSHLVYSGLLVYDENYELQNELATSYEIENDSSRFIFELHPDAVFHNGDPLTAEDVKFTYDFLYEHRDAFAQGPPDPIESVNIIDDRSVEFNFETSYLPFLSDTAARFPIFHEEHTIEAGALDNPGGFSFDEIIGSGPFQVAHFEAGQSLNLTPFDAHPLYNPTHNVILTYFRDLLSAYNSFEEQTLNVAGVSADLMARAQDELEFADTQSIQQLYPYCLDAQMPEPPTMFLEFRDALGTALDRDRMNETGLYGLNEVELHSTLFQEAHPWRPPDERLHKFTDDPSGDIEEARAVLEENGWGWDGDGNLHYPPDADLTPLWPAEDVPSEEDFPCLADLRS